MSETTNAGTPAEGPSAPRSRRARRLRLAGDLLLIVGGLVLSYPFWSAAYAQVQQSRLDSTYQAQSAAFDGSARARLGAGSRAVPTRVLVADLARLYGRKLKPGDPLGRLVIPRIHLDRVVQQGVGGKMALDPAGDRALLRNGPVHYGVTPLPGAGEPFAVAGHRTTYGAPFYDLDKLRSGDRIWVETPYARFRYRFVKSTVVDPSDVSVLADRGYGLVLTTCTPPYSAAHRLVVWAALEKIRVVRAVRRRS